MAFKYHGNWCGPGWSAGKYQNSVDQDYPAVDPLDEACRDHDRDYARGNDLREADLTFARRTRGLGAKAELASLAVFAQGGIRSLMPGKKKTQTVTFVAKPKSNGPTIPKKPKKTGKGSGVQTSLVVAPGNVGVSQRGSNRPRRTDQGPMSRNTLRISGTDYLTQLTTTGSNPGDVLFSMSMSPTNLADTAVKALSSLYANYWFDPRSTWVEYDPGSTTSTAGQIAGYFNPDPADSDLTGVAGVRRAMNAEGAGKHSPWLRGKYAMPLMSKRILYTDADEAGEDPRLEYQGVFKCICSQSLVNGAALGTLILHYTVIFQNKLINPKNQDLAYLLVTHGGTPSVGVPLGTAPNVETGSGIIATFDSSGNIFVSGVSTSLTYIMTILSLNSAVTAWTANPTMVVTGANTVFQDLFYSTTGGSGNQAAGCFLIFNPTTNPVKLDFTLGTGGSFTGYQCYCTCFALTNQYAALPGSTVLTKSMPKHPKLSDVVRRLAGIEVGLRNLLPPGTPTIVSSIDSSADSDSNVLDNIVNNNSAPVQQSVLAFSNELTNDVRLEQIRDLRNQLLQEVKVLMAPPSGK